jgi:hypothetical protein
LEVNWLLDARHGQPAPESQGSVHLVSPANIGFAPLRRKLDGCREDFSQIGFDAIEKFRKRPSVLSGPHSNAHA